MSDEEEAKLDCSKEVFSVSERLEGIGELLTNLSNDFDMNGVRLRGVGKIVLEQCETLEKVLESLDSRDL